MMQKINNIFLFIQKHIGISPETQSKLLISIAIIICTLLLKKIILHFVFKRTSDVKSRYNWKKATTYIVVLMDILLLGRTWFSAFDSLTTFLGLVSAGIAIALKDVIANMVGWIYIILNHPFNLGDRIEIGEHRGDVVDITLFHFLIMEIGNWVDADQSTGRVIAIPNGKLFTQDLANYTTGFEYIWNELPITVTFESDWQNAKEILLKIAEKHTEPILKHAEKKIREASKSFLVFYSKLTPIIYTDVMESGVRLTMRYLCSAKSRRSKAHEIWEEVLTEFSTKDNIDFAYPTVRYYQKDK